MQYHGMLPVITLPHLAIEFAPNSETIVVLCLGNVFYIFDVEENRISKWSRENIQKNNKCVKT